MNDKVLNLRILVVLLFILFAAGVVYAVYRGGQALFGSHPATTVTGSAGYTPILSANPTPTAPPPTPVSSNFNVIPVGSSNGDIDNDGDTDNTDNTTALQNTGDCGLTLASVEHCNN